jgi:2-dehydro-3-deoxygluconokinase
MKKVVSFGEIMLRLSTPGYARFTQAHTYIPTFGGSDANVAASLAVMGIPAAHVTVFPANDLGLAATQAYATVGLDTQYISYGGPRIGTYFVENGAAMRGSRIIYDRAGSSFALAEPSSYNWDLILADAQWFHFTGITPALSENCAIACLEGAKTARKMGLKISCDVGYRSNLWQWGKKPIEVMPQLVELCDLIVCSKSDAADMLQISLKGAETNFSSFCKLIMDRFPQVKTIINTKRGQISASHNTLVGQCFTDGQLLKTKIMDIPHIVDRIGGGDAYLAGFIYGQIMGWSAEVSLHYAVAASALKHTIEGDINLATVPEIEAVMNGDVGGKIKR